MSSFVIRRLAAQNGLKLEGNAAYGVLKGCFITLRKARGHVQMYVYVGCHHRKDDAASSPAASGSPCSIPEHMAAADTLANIFTRLAVAFKACRIPVGQAFQRGKTSIEGVTVKNGYLVQVNFLTGPRYVKNIHTFINAVLPKVAELTQPDQCMRCGSAKNEPLAPVLLSSRAVVPMHADCACEYISAMELIENSRSDRREKGVLRRISAVLTRSNRSRSKILNG